MGFREIARLRHMPVERVKEEWSRELAVHRKFLREQAYNIAAEEIERIEGEVEKLVAAWEKYLEDGKITSAVRLYDLILKARGRRIELLEKLTEEIDVDKSASYIIGSDEAETG